MRVYVAPDIAMVDDLHPYLADASFRAPTIREQIAKQSNVLYAAHAAGDRRVGVHLMSWWPGARGRSLDDVMSMPLTAADALATMSREYGFQDWAEVDALGNTTPEVHFERALDEMLAGDIAQLRSRLNHDPHLVAARSSYGHRSTLLHYLGANGDESHRQRTPLNAAALARLLIEHGADISAEANSYGGGQTALALASTSAHPFAAGIADELIDVLGGATN